MTGIGAFTASLVEALLATSEDFRLVLFRRPEGPFPADERVVQIAVEGGDPRWDHLYLPGLLDLYGVDLYHTPVPLAPLVSPCPVLITIHDAIPRVAREWCDPRFLKWFEAWIGPSLARACHVLTVSEHARIDLMAALELSPEKISSIPQSVGAAFQPRSETEVAALREKYQLPDRYLLFVGTLEPRKNPDGLLRAYAKLREGFPDAPPLVLAGPPGYPRLDVAAFATSLGIAPYVKVLGYVAAADLPALYSGATCACVPSHYEGFGRTVVEAMSCGVPVIASTAGALPETSGGAALLCAPDDPGAWAHAMRQILTDPELATQFRERGLERAQAFSSRKQGESMLALYKHLIATGQPAAVGSA